MKRLDGMCLVALGSKSKELDKGYGLGIHSCQSQLSPKKAGRWHILIVFGWDKW